MLQKAKIERAAYLPIERADSHLPGIARQFDVTLWLSKASASEIRELVEVAGHVLEIRLYVDGKHLPFDTQNSGLKVPGLRCNMAEGSTPTIACPGLEVPAQASDVEGALPTLELALFLDSQSLLAAEVF